MSTTKYGYGDHQTWPSPSGHHLDPRTEPADDKDATQAVLQDMQAAMGRIQREFDRGIDIRKSVDELIGLANDLRGAL